MAPSCNLRSADAVSSALRNPGTAEEYLDEASENENLSIAKSDSETEQSESSTSNLSEYEESVASPAKRARVKDNVSKNIVTGKNGHRWFSTPRERTMNRNNTIKSILPGPVEKAKYAHTPLESWSLLFTDEIINIIITHTNKQMDQDCVDNELDQSCGQTKIDAVELKAFFALLYASGIQKMNNTNVEDLWSAEFGTILYRATMPVARFKFIYRCLRFDDGNTREARKENDKFAPIREIWEKFIAHCTVLYNPTSYCTIDEQLLSFRGRCPFKVYNSSKPDKYGIKVVMMNDSRTSYMYTAIPYVGTVATENGENVPSYYIRKLSEPIHGTNRNITCDNWFSSIPIFDKMLAEHKITMVGTLRKNKTEIPAEFKKSGKPNSEKYAFDATKTLISYTPKVNKVSLLLSTLHMTDGVDAATGKPEIIAFYNSTKGGTDTFDRMCREYTTARETRRWSVRVFFGMLDQCAINAAILYNFNAAHEIMSRRQFLKSLVHDLVVPHLERRRNIPTLRRSILLSIHQILGVADRVHTEIDAGKLVRCRFCPRNLDRKTRVRCSNCGIAACEEHRRTLCEHCEMED